MSYLTRLAAAHHWELWDMLAHLDIRARYKARLQAGGEIYLSPGAQETVTALTGIPQQHLRRALPAWEHTPPDTQWPAERAATARRVPFRLTARGCPRCMAPRVQHAQPTLYLPYQNLLCRTHHVWSLGAHTLDGALLPHAHADVSALPDIAAATRLHRRLLRHHPAKVVAQAFDRAYSAVGYWWLDHGSTDHVWRARAHVMARGSADVQLWTVLGRDPITFPETVELTRLLLRHRYDVQTQAGQDPRQRQLQFESSVLSRFNRPWLTHRYLTRSSNVIYLTLDGSGARRLCRHPIHQRTPRDLKIPSLETMGYHSPPSRGAHSSLWTTYSHRLEHCRGEHSPWRRK
ncbi:hypothetical protein [Actinacidiphila glaucinigra]|uniref:hypothetical protein n=1 Tax=Actinacidiphila glaucinigra TaxID=235986 RepID=UPI003718EB9C